MHKLDETDLRILRAMQSDGGLTIAEIAERVGISQSSCSRRISNMETEGVIRGKQMLLDAKSLGYGTQIIVRLKLHAHDTKSLNAFKKAVRNIPEIQMALLVLGDFDYYLRIMVRDIEHYQRLLQGKLVEIPGVREMQSSVILDVVKDITAVPI